MTTIQQEQTKREQKNRLRVFSLVSAFPALTRRSTRSCACGKTISANKSKCLGCSQKKEAA